MVNAMDEAVLSQLKDIHMPTPPSWWPLPPGYYLVLAALLLLGLMLWFLIRWFNRAPSLKKQACLELRLIEKRFLASNDARRLQTELNRLVRRLAMAKKPNSHRDLPSSIEYLWPNNKKNQQLVELLSADRFKVSATIDGQQLLSLLREQLLCRR